MKKVLGWIFNRFFFRSPEQPVRSDEPANQGAAMEMVYVFAGEKDDNKREALGFALEEQLTFLAVAQRELGATPTIADFKEIFAKCCAERSIEYDDGIIEDLLQNYYRPRRLALRGCHPRDLLDQALAQASYLGEERRLTPALLEAACASYFVDDTEPAPVFV